jgi:AcrR family transcriptional regulator
MDRRPPRGRTPELTRRRLLDAALHEFSANGFQGASLSHIVETAEATKGALFHYFASKHELGYAVLDERIGPLLLKRWLEPLQDATDPLDEMERGLRRYVDEDISSGRWLLGCPLNNLARRCRRSTPAFSSALIGCTRSGARTTAARSSAASLLERSSRRSMRAMPRRSSWRRTWASGAAARARAARR